MFLLSSEMLKAFQSFNVPKITGETKSGFVELSL